MSKSTIPPWLKTYDSSRTAIPGGEETVKGRALDGESPVRPVEIGPVHIDIVRGLATTSVTMKDDDVRLVIGHGREEADMPLVDPQMAQRQLVLLRLGSELLIINSAPRNPMRINGVETLQGSLPVPTRALIEVASTALIITAEGTVQSPEAPKGRHLAPRPGEAHLNAEPDGSSVTLEVESGPTVTLVDRHVVVGSDSRSDLRFRHHGLVNHHFLISPTADGIMLVPIVTDNLRVNGKDVEGPQALENGDVIDVSKRNITVSFTGDPVARAKRMYSHDYFKLKCFMFRSLYSEIAHSFMVERDSGSILLGRSEECDVVMAESSISRRHATLAPNPNNILIVDEGSSNGTFINELPVSRNRVQAGDLMEFGRNPFLVHYA